MYVTASFTPSVVTSDSPCIGHCSTVLGDEVCRSCLRTFDEITRWVAMNDDERRAVNQRIALLDIQLQHQSTILPDSRFRE